MSNIKIKRNMVDQFGKHSALVHNILQYVQQMNGGKECDIEITFSRQKVLFNYGSFCVPMETFSELLVKYTFPELEEGSYFNMLCNRCYGSMSDLLWYCVLPNKKLHNV